jgi:hypothetical protein
MPPPMPSSRRTVPLRLTDEQRDRLAFLLEDPDTWVLRPGWERFLLHGEHVRLVETDSLSADHRTAALAWLRQQRHALHRALTGEPIAPDGWLEGLPLVARLLELDAVGHRGSGRR